MNPVAQIQKLLVVLMSASWKTTVAGLAYALFTLKPEYDAYMAGQHVSKHAVAAAFAAALIGYFARDWNVSSEMQSGVPGAAMPKAPPKLTFVNGSGIVPGPSAGKLP
jgi:hypothetical protein